jgi:hypothetical protein
MPRKTGGPPQPPQSVHLPNNGGVSERSGGGAGRRRGHQVPRARALLRELLLYVSVRTLLVEDVRKDLAVVVGEDDALAFARLAFARADTWVGAWAGPARHVLVAARSDTVREGLAHGERAGAGGAAALAKATKGKKRRLPKRKLGGHPSALVPGPRVGGRCGPRTALQLWPSAVFRVGTLITGW